MRDRRPPHARRPPYARRVLLPLLAAALLLPLAACTSDAGDGRGSGPVPSDDGRARTGTLRVLASSELSDMKPLLEEARKATGITVRPTWAGTLDAVERLASGEADGAFDAVWLSSNDYLRLDPEAAGRIASETPLMAVARSALGAQARRRCGGSAADAAFGQLERRSSRAVAGREN
ncbi:hypothetical protein SBADM41S_12222 [Streptomyces badius]